MTSTAAEGLKDKLNSAIQKRMETMRQDRTQAISAIAETVNVQPRAVYKWLEGSLPHEIDSVMLNLDRMIDEMEKFKIDTRSPAITTNMSFPFRISIPRHSVKITQDEQGNIILHGSMSVDLL